MASKKLTSAMIRELRAIQLSGQPSDYVHRSIAPVLYFWARDKVIGALLTRDLIIDEGVFRLTDAGRAALAAIENEALA